MPEPSTNGSVSANGHSTPSSPADEVHPSDPSGTNGNGRGGYRGGEDELADARAQAHYWRCMYRVMYRILAAQHDDPALAWLDEIVHTRFSKLL